jgi:hypothetical protein
MMADTVTSRDAASGEISRDGSYVDWPCAIAGAVVSSAVSFVLFTFGSGIGLSIVSPWSGAGSSMVTFAILATLFTVVVQVSAFAAGGYLAGRMRRPWNDSKSTEIEYRDGVHGALVWAVGALLGALILAATAGGLARGAVDVSSAARSGNSSTDMSAYAIDGLLRSNRVPEALNVPGQGQGSDALRLEIGRLMAGAARGDFNPADRTYLAQLVASRTGLSQAEAEARVDQTISKAKAVADKARKGGIIAAFLAAASLMAGLVAAWSAAMIGGSHRDQGIIWRGLARHEAATVTRAAVRR